MWRLGIDDNVIATRCLSVDVYRVTFLFSFPPGDNCLDNGVGALQCLSVDVYCVTFITLSPSGYVEYNVGSTQ